MPVTGLTSDSQRVADQHYNEYLETERLRKEEYDRLEMSTLQEDADRLRMSKSKPGGGQANGQEEDDESDSENVSDALNKAA